MSRNKIIPPVSSPYTIARQHILEKLEHDLARLILVTAPAGFGKTASMLQLQDFYRQRGEATAWLNLDDSDNDVSRFLASFSAALKILAEESAVPLPQESSNNADVAQWLTDIVGGTARPLSIFFDDFEALRNPVVIGLVARGIDIMPAGSRVVIGSRRQPEIGLASLRARGQLREIDGSELRFSEFETREFLCNRRGLELSPEDLAQLYHNTDGWVTALWLASLALERRVDGPAFVRGFSGSNAAVAAYLAEDVLSGLPEDLRSFLLRISILDELRPEVCNAICGCDDSLEKLRELERQNLFLEPVDEQRDWYTFNALFQDFLQNQLKRDFAAELPSLYSWAAEAYLALGRPIKAIRYALLAGNVDFAMPLINQYVDDLLGQGRLRLLAGLLDLVPFSELIKHPRLRLIHAWSVAFTRGPQEALALIESIDGAELGDESATYYFQALRPMLLAMLDRVDEAHTLGMAALSEGILHYAFASAMLYQALTQTSIILGAHQDARRFVDVARSKQDAATGEFGFVLAESADALLDLMSGRLRQASARLKLATQRFAASRQGQRRGNALSAIQLAEVLYEAGDCSEAKRLLATYSPLVKDLGPPDALITSHVLLARIELTAGEHDHALQLLTDLETAGHRLKLPRVTASARLERANIYLSQGHVDGAQDQLQQAEQCFVWPDMNSRWYAANDTLYPALVSLRLMLRAGKATKAIPLLRKELKEAESTLRGRRALKLRILLAEAMARDGQRNMALRALSRAQRFSQAEGFSQTFVEEGETIQALLHELQNEYVDGPLEEDAAQSISEPRSDKPSPEVVSKSLSDPLTKKELQVLTLLAEGLANQAMAERLFISESTVRTHLRSINLKLAAGNRTQAIAIARRLGLVE